MANKIEFNPFDMPKDEIKFSTEVSAIISLPQDYQVDDEVSSLLSIEEKRNSVITREGKDPAGETDVKKVIPHIVSIITSRSSRSDYIFDLTFTLGSGSTLRYPYVYTLTLLPTPVL